MRKRPFFPAAAYVAVRNAHVAAAIHVHAVAIGGQDGEIARQHVMAVLEADRLIAHARRLCALAPARPSAPDLTVTENGNAAKSFAPDQAVAKVAVAEVLVLVPFIRLADVEPTAEALRGRINRNDGRACI